MCMCVDDDADTSICCAVCARDFLKNLQISTNALQFYLI